MALEKLTHEQHIAVLEKLVNLAKSKRIKQRHKAGSEYTALMGCFLEHSVTTARCLLHLHNSFGNNYFPSINGYILVRPMFEIDVTSHYITQNPSERAKEYIEYEAVVEKKRMDKYSKHKQSKNKAWKYLMEDAWKVEWENKEKKVNDEYKKFENMIKKNNGRSWSGKSIKAMAQATNHEEAYDTFYADLSRFTHAGRSLVDRYITFDSDKIHWTSKSDHSDVSNVFRYADIFLSCFLTLFGNEFDLWKEQDVENCWA